ncbi:MAG TPA: magnesium/cobalt transporter CorA, partial [Anaerolineales bacterium]|nr:magnesium/cobalt transporter CorA [Anaerolineales bacterium]
LAAALQDQQGLVWVDFVGESVEASEPVLRDVFHFHPLAIDDALRETHIPKVDDWTNYLYIAMYAVEFGRATQPRLQAHALDAFLGETYLVTHHDHSIAAVDRIWDRCQTDERLVGAGPDHLFYALSDEVIMAYMRTVEDLDQAIDELEDAVLARPSPETLQDVLSLKGSLLNLRRLVGPQREVFNKLARDEYAMIDPRDRIYFRDVYDHLVRLHDINESMRDQVGGALEIYLSVINNRMNEIMKTLTIITTLFMPISFLTGFFGMNFFGPVAPRLGNWTGMPSFLIALAVLLLTPMGFYLWFRRRAFV